MTQKIDSPFYTRDLLIFFYLGKKIYDTIEYTIVTLCNTTIGLFSVIIGLKH